MWYSCDVNPMHKMMVSPPHNVKFMCNLTPFCVDNLGALRCNLMEKDVHTVTTWS